MADSVPFEFDADVVRLDGKALIEARGEVDLLSSGRLSAVLDEAFSSKPDLVAVNLFKVTFMDATVLLKAKKQADAARIAFVLQSPQPIVRRVLGTLELDTVFRIES